MKFNNHFSRITMFMVAISTTITFFAMIRVKYPKQEQETKMTHLVPTDRQSMEELGLCPLFIKKKAAVDPDILHDITETMRMVKATENEIQAKIAELTFPGREYHIFKEGAFKTKQVDAD